MFGWETWLHEDLRCVLMAAGWPLPAARDEMSQ